MAKPNLQSALKGEGKHISQVALRAGVSNSTVSRVMNGNPAVDSKLARRVLNAVEELDYVPNSQARALVSGRSRTLGLLVTMITNPFFPELIESFEEVANENGFEVMVGSIDKDPDRAKLFVRRLLQRRVEGVAVMTFRTESPLLDKLVAQKIPLVYVDVLIESPGTSVLEVDYVKGIDEAVQHLAVLGHRKLAFVNGPQSQLTNVRRREAFLQAIRRVGLPANVAWMPEGHISVEGGIRAAEDILRLSNRPTAILCSNDMMAVGVLRLCAQRQIRVPGQISVVGFGDINLAEFANPSLTTVRISRVDLARRAFEALTFVQGRDNTKMASKRVLTSLVVRESSGFDEEAGRGITLARAPSPDKRYM